MVIVERGSGTLLALGYILPRSGEILLSELPVPGFLGLYAAGVADSPGEAVLNAADTLIYQGAGGQDTAALLKDTTSHCVFIWWLQIPLLLCMTLFLGVDQAEAQGINLLFFLPTAGLSLLYHRKNGFLDRAALRSAAPIGTACALVAALISSSVELAILRKPFGLFLIYAGVTLLLPAKPHKRGAAQ